VPIATPPLRLKITGTSQILTITPSRLIVAGYTGRDEDAVAAHIAELAAIGVPPPATVPAFYDLDPGLLTTDPVVSVHGPDTSGEVEPVIIRHQGRYYLAVGSDHTDRELEQADICRSKAACPKPLGDSVVPLPDDLADLAEFAWDDVVASSEADGLPYQQGTLAALWRPGDLLARIAASVPGADGDLVLFCGTLPLLTGRFVAADGWKLRLVLRDGTVLAHAYETKRRND
jgi:hypothetical protein